MIKRDRFFIFISFHSEQKLPPVFLAKNLRGEVCISKMERLTACGLPCVISTGYPLVGFDTASPVNRRNRITSL
jgi:hypothetical protein